MACRRRNRNDSSGSDKLSTRKSIVLHIFSDLSRTLPPVFVYILKQSYVHGKGKAVVKFQALRQQVIGALPSAPPPGPATYVIHCLNVLLLIEPPYSEGLSHLLTSALSHVDNRPFDDAIQARKLAAQLFASVIAGSVTLEERILIKMATVFDIRLDDLVAVIYGPALDAENFEKAKAILEAFILTLIRSRLYSSAVSLLKQFALQHSTPQEFLVAMIRDNQVEAAEQWAAYMGKHMICSLVQHCINMSMFKKAYKIVQKYKLKPEFPDAYYQYRKSSLRKLVQKGCWDIAELIANDDCQLVEHLVVLAQEIGDTAKAVDICHRYCLTDLPLCSVQARSVIATDYLQLPDLISEEHVIWIDTIEGLADAARHFTEVKVVGIDCEWRPNYLKGKEPNKVSILQIATGKKVFIFDLIKLFEEERDALNNCLKPVFHSSNILKLGYALHNDLEQLLQSYGHLECFHYCESTLDLQKLSGTYKGGLSGLTKTVLGGHLNKTRRMSNWEQRPLSYSQLHYAALDAAVLISIFNTMCCETLALGTVGVEGTSKWKSHIVSSKCSSEHNDSFQHLDGRVEAMVASGVDVHTPICCSSDMASSLEEELVYASCELLGLPTPGLLKSELQHYAQTANLPLPSYNVSHTAGPGNIMLYCCSVTFGEMKFYGRPASSKKEAEIWAALQALYYASKDQ